MSSMSIGDEALTGLLLREGADVHARRPDGSTVLHVAAQWRTPAAVVRMVLAAGADPIARDREGKTPADYSREGDPTELAQLLDAPAPDSAAMPAREATAVTR